MSLKGGEAVQASGGMSQFDANVRDGTITVYEVPIPQQPLVWMNDGKVPPPEDKLKF